MPQTRAGFEWFVAWRHLRDPAGAAWLAVLATAVLAVAEAVVPLVLPASVRLSGGLLLPAVVALPGASGVVGFVLLQRDHKRMARRFLLLGLVLLKVAIAAMLIRQLKLEHTALAAFRTRPVWYVEYLWWVSLVGYALAGTFLFLGVLLETFTVFTAISIAGVFIGTAVPIMGLSVMSGFETDLKGKIRGSKADVVITRAEDRPFTGWQEILRKVADVPGVAAAMPYVEGEVMLRSGGTPAGVILRGIDTGTAAAVLDLNRSLKEGRLDDLDHPERVKDVLDFGGTLHNPDEEEEPGGTAPPKNRPPRPTIILGEELYGKSLRVFIGSDMDVVCPLCGTGPTGARPKSRPFRVSGHFYSGMYEFDSKLAYISLEEAQRFFGMEGEITGIDLRTRDPDRADAVATAIQGRVGPGYEVRSWQELNQELFRALRLEKIAMFIVLTFIALVASFSIASLLIMMTTQKSEEVAILKAMGATDGGILRVFFAEGLYIGLIGVILGLGAGILGCLRLKTQALPADVYYISQLPVVMRSSEITTVAVVAVVLCCLATVYPALRASRMRPVEGLRYE